MNREAALYYQGLMKETVEQFQQTNKQIANLITQRQKLLASESENEMVEAEFNLIEDDDTPVYKLVGEYFKPIHKVLNSLFVIDEQQI